MKFIIRKKDGPARIGEFTIENKKIITPNNLFINTQRFKAPAFSEIFLTKNKEKTKKPSLKFSEELLSQRVISDKNYAILSIDEEIKKKIKDNSAIIFVVANALQLIDQPKKFVDFIVDVREKIGYQKILYLPSVGTPINLALLSYIGVDLFDSTQAIIAARNNILFFETGMFKIHTLQEISCKCPSCNKLNKKPMDMNFQEILNHNYYAIDSEIKLIRNAIVQENLRNLVEIKVKADPILTAILRNLDYKHYNFLEKRIPVHSKGKIIATTIESLYRPEIKRFQDRVINRYKKPESAKILLLLPCSAKKPYSFSKSHKLFREKLLSTINPFVVHELIITSPMGIVPRELELLYPASSYDIPVTGIWDENEKKMINDLLSKYLLLNKYENIIVHLPKELTDFIQPVLKKPVLTCIDNPISKESLNNLQNTLNSTVDCYEKIKSNKRAKENVESLAAYQFGKSIAKELLGGCEIRGKYPYQKIINKNTQLGMVTKERGLISLTMHGAEKISKFDKYWVEIYSDFELIGSIFAPGVKDADHGIRVGDEVIITRNKKICAVGVAQMNRDEIVESNQGEAVKVRHRI